MTLALAELMVIAGYAVFDVICGTYVLGEWRELVWMGIE